MNMMIRTDEKIMERDNLTREQMMKRAIASIVNEVKRLNKVSTNQITEIELSYSEPILIVNLTVPGRECSPTIPFISGAHFEKHEVKLLRKQIRKDLPSIKLKY